MNQSNLYIPNPQKWLHFFKNNKAQVGKGMFIPSQSSTESKDVNFKVVSPAEQTVEQAKSELKRDNINTSKSSLLPHIAVSPQTVKSSKRGVRKGLKLNKKQKNQAKPGKRVVNKETSKPKKILKITQKHSKKGSSKPKKILKIKQKNNKKGYNTSKYKKQKPFTTWDIFGN